MRRKESTMNYIMYGVVIFIFMIIYKLYKGGQILGNSIANTIKNDIQNTEIQKSLNQYGITDVRVQGVTEIANRIYDALDRFWQSESEAVQAFNSLQNINEAKACASIYKSLFGRSLYGHLDDSIHFADWNNIKPYLLAAIKGL